MSTSLDSCASGLVRPRYTDAEVVDPLPLWDRFQEACLGEGEPPVFLVVGRRGSGITTALGYLAARCLEAGWQVVSFPSAEPLPPEPPPRALLLVDLSVTPLDAAGLDGFAQQALPAGWARAPVLVGVSQARETPAPTLLRLVEERVPPAGRARVQVTLAPWGQDDLIELLGSEAYREQRAAVLGRLAALPGIEEPLRRPWSARLLIEAVCALAPGEPPTLAKVYANVLDALCPTTLDVLRDLSGTALTRRELGRFPLELEREAAEELSLLLQTPREVAEHMVREDAPTPTEFEAELGTLLLPGLASFVQAGECVRWLTQGEEPPPLRPDWVPFFPDLAGPELLRTLTRWLSEPNPPVHADGAMATILHACGQALPFGRRQLLVQGAILRGVAAASADLSGSRFENANLAGADLTGADLRGSSWSQCCLDGARGAELVADASWWRGCALADASFPRSQSRGLRCESCDLPGSDWSESRLQDTRFEDCDLSRATFRGAQLAGCTFDRGRLDGATFSGARVSHGRFEYLDLSAADLGGARLERTVFVRCGLAGVHLGLAGAAEGEWLVCDLSGADFAGVPLPKARFCRCLANGADFSRCDLRDAVFEEVRFELGSTREGLLLGEPASEGTRSGYYAEGTTDDAWATQPDLPLASFREADLRGASFSGSLFRLDLRGATLDPELRARAKREGALLDP
ncbi:MAG: pentapeptide repeat-containing protein [Planctomycetes bacterium]|nr:pentapeptide repeat-containing protein [Planctomycetota bacterium]